MNIDNHEFNDSDICFDPHLTLSEDPKDLFFTVSSFANHMFFLSRRDIIAMAAYLKVTPQELNNVRTQQ